MISIDIVIVFVNKKKDSEMNRMIFVTTPLQIQWIVPPMWMTLDRATGCAFTMFKSLLGAVIHLSERNWYHFHVG